MSKINWKYNNDVGDVLTAIENALCSVTDAMEEIEGLGELQDVYGAIADTVSDLETLKDQTESYMSGEYQQQLAEMAREYYRSVM